MAKDKLTDYDSTASGNLDVGGISVAEGMLPSGVNNAIRELMSHQADFAAGTQPITKLATASIDANGGTIKLDGNYPVGTGNVALGDTALDSNVSGASNTAIGADALTANTANNNTAVGYQAGYVNTTGTNNVFNGYRAGYGNTEGASNVASGLQSLFQNTTGNYNVAMGQQALQANTTASDSTTIGYQAGYSLTTNGEGTMVGHRAGYSTTGAKNTFIGKGSGFDVTSGANNTILGRFSGNQGGLDIRTSSNNIVLSDGDGNPRLYINSAGDCKIGGGNTSQGYQAVGLTAFANGETTIVRDGASPVTCTRKSSAGHIIDFYNTTTFSGYINVNGSTTSYATSSDYRLKENVVDLTGATTRLKQLEPKRFNFIGDADTTVDGFLAHEVQDIVPEAIGGTKDEVDVDGNPVYQGIDQSKLVPLLTAALQEALTKIDALETRIAALEA